MKKKILVIGGTGFIGHHLLKKTVELGWTSFSISRKKPSKNRKVRKVKYILFDLKDQKKFFKKITLNYDYIVDLSNTSLSSSKFFNQNLSNNFFKKKLSKFLLIGSSAEYGNSKGKPIKENFICKPISKYGRKKLKFTKNLQKNFKENFFPLIILRLFQVYGSNDNKDKIIPYTIKNCKNDKKFNLTTGIQTRDFCHIDDVIRAIILSLKIKNKKIFGNIFNVGTGEAVSIKNLVLMIYKIIGKGHPNFGYKKIQKKNIMFSKSSILKIKKHIKWSPRITLERGIKNLIQNEK